MVGSQRKSNLLGGSIRREPTVEERTASIMEASEKALAAFERIEKNPILNRSDRRFGPHKHSPFVEGLKMKREGRGLTTVEEFVAESHRRICEHVEHVALIKERVLQIYAEFKEALAKANSELPPRTSA